jgi:hypothetical protein
MWATLLVFDAAAPTGDTAASAPSVGRATTPCENESGLTPFVLEGEGGGEGGGGGGGGGEGGGGGGGGGGEGGGAA